MKKCVFFGCEIFFGAAACLMAWIVAPFAVVAVLALLAGLAGCLVVCCD